MAVKKQKVVKKKPQQRAALRQSPRTKTDVRMSPALMGEIEDVCLLLGQTKNGFLLMGAAYVCALLRPLVRGKATTAEVRARLQQEFDKVMAAASA